MDNMAIRERFTDIVVPLLVMSVYLSLNGKGFLTAWPLIACTVYAIAQPFVRFFVTDRLRDALVADGQERVFLAASTVLYSALGMVVVELLV